MPSDSVLNRLLSGGERVQYDPLGANGQEEHSKAAATLNELTGRMLECELLIHEAEGERHYCATKVRVCYSQSCSWGVPCSMCAQRGTNKFDAYAAI